MNRQSLSLIVLALAATAAHADPFQSFAGADTTCYNWNGGNFSAGSFSKCRTDVIVAAAPKAVPVTPAPVAVAPSPVMMPMSCPPPPVIQPRKHKPRPKPVCK